MKKFKVTVAYYDGSKLEVVTREVVARSEEQIYRDAIFEYYTELVYVFAVEADYPLDLHDYEDKFFVVDKAEVYTIFADTDCPYGYIGREIRIVHGTLEAFLQSCEDSAGCAFIRRIRPDERMQWVDGMREFACR